MRVLHLRAIDWRRRVVLRLLLLRWWRLLHLRGCLTVEMLDWGKHWRLRHVRSRW